MLLHCFLKKISFPELLRVVPVILDSGQRLNFISIVIICDTQNMGVTTNLLFLQTEEKLFQTEILFPLICLTSSLFQTSLHQ